MEVIFLICLIKQDIELFKNSMKNINVLFWSYSSEFKKICFHTFKDYIIASYYKNF